MKRIVSLIAAAAVLSVPLAGCATDLPVSVAESRYTNAASRFVTLDTGTRVHVRDEGPRDAPALVLLHGSNASLHTWEPWVARLKDRYRLISLDLPAHGLTGPAGNGLYTTGASVALVDALTRQLGVQRFALAGNSMGGGIAWRYALAHPERVSALILVSAAGYPREGSAPLVFRLARAPVLGEIFSNFTGKGILESQLKSVIVDDALVTPAMVDRYHDLLMRKGNRQATLARLRTAPDDPEAWRRIGQIKAPTLILWGEQDPWIPLSDARRFAADITGAQVITYREAGHLAHEELPDRTAADVARFLGGLPAAPPSP